MTPAFMSSFERCVFAARYASIALEMDSCISGFTATGADAERRRNASCACCVHQLASACASGTGGPAERAAPAAGRAGGMRRIAWTARGPPHALAYLEPFPRKPTLWRGGPTKQATRGAHDRPGRRASRRIAASAGDTSGTRGCVELDRGSTSTDGVLLDDCPCPVGCAGLTPGGGGFHESEGSRRVHACGGNSSLASVGP